MHCTFNSVYIYNGWMQEDGKDRMYLKHLADIAGAKDLVDDGKLVRILRREVGREHALLGAPPPQQLARCAGRRAAAAAAAPAPGHGCQPHSRALERACSEKRMDDDYLIAKGWKEGKKRGRLPAAEPPLL